jgi:elongation factor Ts
MSTITAAQVKELRDATGISMLKCKNALEEAAGDIEKARDILRKGGEKDAAKKADRATGEGVVVAKVIDGGKKAVLVQVFCETDFVARGDDFQKLANDLADLALTKGADAAKAEAESLVQAAIQKVGENVQLGEIEIAEEPDGVIGSYMHGNQKIGVLVSLKTGAEEVAKDVAMQIAAMNPSYLLPEEVPAEEVAKEKEIQKELLAKEGKPAEMVEKIMAGKLKKFREEQSLIKQSFVKDPSKTIEQFLQEADAEIEQFLRLAI